MSPCHGEGHGFESRIHRQVPFSKRLVQVQNEVKRLTTVWICDVRDYVQIDHL